MLYLKQSGVCAADVEYRRVRLTDRAAACLERALLAGNNDVLRRELNQALAEDAGFAGWVLRLAEHRTGRTTNRVDEAAEWLSGRLAIELAEALNVDVPAQSSDESRLATLVIKLADYERKLADFEHRLEREKLEALKELAYGASHEINNPLANIAARAQTLVVGEQDPERARKLSAIHRQAMRAHEMISDLMLFARPPKLVLRPVDLRQLINRVVAEQREFASEREVELCCDTGLEPFEVLADETQLGVAFHAVLKNALEAVPGGGHVWITARGVHAELQHFAEICVRDDGPGFSETARKHIFDPFFSGREAGRGLGFGLSKCWRIVTDHGGQVVVARSAGGGAEFSILLPLSSPVVSE
jgi:signal transduction histidine kinase